MAEPTNEVASKERFFRYFQHEITALQESMQSLSSHSTAGGERNDAIEHILARISRLSSDVKDASSYIPPYDQRIYSEAISALSSKLQSIRASFAPRAKFAFKSGNGFTTQKNASAISLNDAAELASQQRMKIPGWESSAESSFATTPAELRSPAPERVDEGEEAKGFDGNDPVNKVLHAAQQASIRKPSFSQSTSVSISNHNGIHIILPSSAAHATSSGTLSNLSNCVVDMSVPTATGGPFAGLTLKNIKNSLIVCGHVNGAAHITNVFNSVIVVSARQFRMHESRNCDVYLQCSSRPIIEDCNGIQFAPLPKVYVSRSSELYRMNNLLTPSSQMTENDTRTENNWDQVDDFKWLKSEPSPNWSILSKHVDEHVWRDIVPGAPGKGLGDILHAVNLPKA
ncbi:hypothetical protein LTR66_010030 [Elasticomyces elasticus]|nr:hypothetical protein LTR66_010030 [Elasticomyces elasticus]